MPTTLYLGAPRSGKSTLMRTHVDELARAPDAPLFFIVDHDDSWGELVAKHGGKVYESTDAWWTDPAPLAAFRGVPATSVAALVIAAGWAVYVDDEVDGALTEVPWTRNPLRELVKRGRHLRNRAGEVTACAAMLATHRPANLPTDILGAFERVYVGRMMGWTDAERVHREGWLPGVATAREVLDELVNRPPGRFSVWPG